MAKNGPMVTARGWSTPATLPSLSPLSSSSGLTWSFVRPAGFQLSNKECPIGSSTLGCALRQLWLLSSPTHLEWTRVSACTRLSLTGGYQLCPSLLWFCPMTKPASSSFAVFLPAAGLSERPTTRKQLSAKENQKMAAQEGWVCTKGHKNHLVAAWLIKPGFSHG